MSEEVSEYMQMYLNFEFGRATKRIPAVGEEEYLAEINKVAQDILQERNIVPALSTVESIFGKLLYRAPTDFSISAAEVARILVDEMLASIANYGLNKLSIERIYNSGICLNTDTNQPEYTFIVLYRC